MVNIFVILRYRIMIVSKLAISSTLLSARKFLLGFYLDDVSYSDVISLFDFSD